MLLNKKYFYLTVFLLFSFIFGNGSNYVFAQINIQRVKAVPARGNMEDIMNDRNDYDDNEDDIDEEEVEEVEALKIIPKRLDDDKEMMQKKMQEEMDEEMNNKDDKDDEMMPVDNHFPEEDDDDLEGAREKVKEIERVRQGMFIRAKAFEASGGMFFDIDWEGEDSDMDEEKIDDEEEMSGRNKENEKMMRRVVWGVLSDEDDYSSLPLGMAIAMEDRQAPLFLPGIYLKLDKNKRDQNESLMFDLEVDARSLRWAAEETKKQVQQILADNQNMVDMDVFGLKAAQIAINNPVIDKIKIESPTTEEKGKIKIEYQQPIKFLGIFEKTVPAVLEVDDDCNPTGECPVEIEYQAPWWLKTFSFVDKDVINNLTKSAKELKASSDKIFNFFN